MPGFELNSVPTGGVTVSLGIAGCLLAAAAARFPQLQGTTLCVPCLGCFRAAPEERLLFSGQRRGRDRAGNCGKSNLVLLPIGQLAIVAAAKITAVQRYQFDFHLSETEGLFWDRC